MRRRKWRSEEEEKEEEVKAKCVSHNMINSEDDSYD